MSTDTPTDLEAAGLEPVKPPRMKITLVIEDADPAAEGYATATISQTFEPELDRSKDPPQTPAMHMVARIMAAIRPYAKPPAEQEKDRAARAEALEKVASQLERPALKLLQKHQRSPNGGKKRRRK